MNYSYSRNDIIPEVNDTPALLTSLKNRLTSRTRYDVPFFLMPVRTETRFMRVPRNLLDDVFSEPTKAVFATLDKTDKALTAYGLYQGFDNNTLHLAGAEIMEGFASMMEQVQAIPSVNTAERKELASRLNTIKDTSAGTLNTMISLSTDGEVSGFLQSAVQQTFDITQTLVTVVADKAEDTSWQEGLTDEFRMKVAAAAEILAANDQVIAQLQQWGGLQEGMFNQFSENTSQLINAFAGTYTTNERLYIHDMMSGFNNQYSIMYSYASNYSDQSPPDVLQPYQAALYNLGQKMKQATGSILLPGYVPDPITPVIGADNITEEQLGDLSPEVQNLRTVLNDLAVNATNSFNAMTLAQEDGNVGAFGEYINAVKVMGDFMLQMNVVASSFDDKAALWLTMKPINEQAKQAKDIVAAFDPGNTKWTDQILGTLQDATLHLGNQWDKVIAIDHSTVEWVSLTQIVDELWIRVFPDDIFINSHERGLTDAEVADGIQYWTSWWAAHGDAKLQLAAWQALVAIYGPERAAWIAHVMTPTNYANAVISNPVFAALDQTAMLSDYVGELTTMSFSEQQANVVGSSHWEFLTPQLQHLSRTLEGSNGTLEAHATSLKAAVNELSQKFVQLGDRAVTIANQLGIDPNGGEIIWQPGEGEQGEVQYGFSLTGTIQTVNQQFNGIATQLQQWNVVTSWDQLYNQAPQFPTPLHKDGNFTEASYSNVMPDRFLFAAVDDYKSGAADPVSDAQFGSYNFKHIKIGNIIPQTLYTGIDPLSGNFTDTAIGSLNIDYLQPDPKILWMFDFYNAVQNGMATIIRLVKTEPQKGFDKILVLGLNLQERDGGVSVSTLPGIGKRMLEQLLENHHYTPGGMSLLQLGTPTNNTDGSNAGYNQPDPNSLFSFQTEVSSPLFSTTTTTLNKKDGQWLADALGIDYSYLQHIANADKTQISNAIGMNRALAQGTIGSYMREMMNFLFTDRNITDVTAYFNDYVLARGALPSIRIAEQPYGILPVTSFGRWDWTRKFNLSNFPTNNEMSYDENSNGIMHIESFFQRDYDNFMSATDRNNYQSDRFNNRLSQVLEKLNKTWMAMNAWYVKTVDKNTGTINAQKDFMEILGGDAVMAEAYSRILVNDAGFNKNFQPYQAGGYKIPMWSEPGTPQLPDIFFSMFNNFHFNMQGPASLVGTEQGIFDITEFLDADAPSGLLGSGLMDRIKNALRIFTIRHLTEKYNLYGPTVDEKLTLSENEGLTQYSAKNYIQWLRAASPSAIWNLNDFKHMQSRSLLFLLMRQSVLLTYRDTAWDILEKSNFFTKSARKLVGTPEGILLQQAAYGGSMFDKQILTKWDLLFKSVSSLIGNTMLSGPLSFFSTYQSPNDGLTLSVGYSSMPAPTNITAAPPDWQNTVLGNYLKNGLGGTSSLLGATDRTAINNLNSALDMLGKCSVAELDRLTREHIDLCTYRLDAWNYAMVNKKLWQQRNADGANSAGARKTGIYLGAYGWLHDIRPKGFGALKQVTTNMPTHLTNNETVYFDKTNLGFIQTPSVAHALTAAILRSGYVSENKSTDNRFAVNLSSERVTAALSLVEGIRNGQNLHALLGYEFERGLHERHATLELDAYIYQFRKVYPLTDPALIENNIQDSANATSLTQNIRPQNVTDGVALLNTFRGFIAGIFDQNPHSTIYDMYNLNLADSAGHTFSWHYTNTIHPAWTFLPSSLTDPDTSAIIVEIDRIANQIDALGDLAVAEGVFQVANGNMSRSAAVLEALTEGKNPTDPEIIQTPTTGYHLTHRLVAAIRPLDSQITFTSNYNYTTNPWPSLSETPRSLAEPSLNNWVAGLLLAAFPSGTTMGAIPGGVGCRVSYRDSSNVTHDIAVSIADLQLQPIDLLYMVQGDNYSDEMMRRIIYCARSSASLTVDVPVTVRLDDKYSLSLASLDDILTLLGSIAKIVTGSRWMRAEDFLGTPTATPSATIPFNTAELEYRLNELKTALASRVSILATITTINATNLYDARNYLRDAAGFAAGFAVPVSAVDTMTNTTVIADLQSLYKKTTDDLTARNTKATAAMTAPGWSALTGEDKMKACMNVFGIILGEDFKVLPHFSFDVYTGMKAAIDAQLHPSSSSDDILRYSTDVPETMDNWLYSLARVQEKIDDTETVRMFMTDGLNNPLKQLRPVQFPFVTSATAPVTDYWMGADYPSTYEPTGDKVSITTFNYAELSPNPSTSYGYNCGLVLDDWTEIIPVSDVTTGITFNYDQPNAKAPQSVLLAVSPQVMQPGETGTKPWKLDDLLHTLLDTLDMAKIRMVEPDHFRKAVAGVDKDPYTGGTPNSTSLNNTLQFEVFKFMLPAIVGEMTPHRVDDNTNVDLQQYEGTDSVQQVSFDYNPNNDAPPVVPGTTTSVYTHAADTYNWSNVSADTILASDGLQQFILEQGALTNVSSLQDQLTNLIAQQQTL